MKRIFISRSLKPSSPIRQVIGQNQLTDQSLIQFSKLDFDTPEADWIFFYSRNGVKFFFQNGNYELYPFLWACMNKGTADELSHYVTDTSFVGSGTPEEIAESFKQHIDSGQKVCFIRANNSKDSIMKLLVDHDHFSIPVYDNVPVENVPDQEFDILIFTSPLNAEVWFRHSVYNGEKVIAIGTTTADHLKNSLGIETVITAENPSESSIAECLASLL